MHPARISIYIRVFSLSCESPPVRGVQERQRDLGSPFDQKGQIRVRKFGAWRRGYGEDEGDSGLVNTAEHGERRSYLWPLAKGPWFGSVYTICNSRRRHIPEV